MFNSYIKHKVAVSKDKYADLVETENQHWFFVF